jgi:hypothetical protein
VFPLLGLKISTPRRGALVWSNKLSDDVTPDKRLLHAVCTPVYGNKWSLITHESSFTRTLKYCPLQARPIKENSKFNKNIDDSGYTYIWILFIN